MKILIIMIAIIAQLYSYSVQAAIKATDERPNLLVIVVDDQRWDEMGVSGHPYLQTPNMDRLANEGVQFTSAYSTTPLCSPNRASILTGQYASRHGIIDNIARDSSSHRLNLFAIDLQKTGYETAHIGKWHMGNDPTPRPGYDYWVSFPGQGRSRNPELYEEGRLHEVTGYLTDVLTDRAVEFIRKERTKPFFLYIGHKAVHPDLKQLEDSSVDLSKPAEFVPAPRHVGTYKNKIFPRRKNYQTSVEELNGKLVLQQALLEKLKIKLDLSADEQTIRNRAEMLLAVDEGLGRIINELDQQGILDSTAILFTSDNGYFYGEHNLSVERRLPYEEAVRVPLLFRYPKLIKPNQKVDEFVLSIDIAPTMLDLAKVKIEDHIQGKSFIPLISDKEKTIAGTHWRKSFLMEYVSYEKPMSWLVDTSYKAVRMGRYKYIHWLHHQGKDELYDLKVDPYELENKIADAKMKSVLKKIRTELSHQVSISLGLD